MSKKDRRRPTRRISRTVSLIRTCRQTRSEAELLMFSHTTFSINYPEIHNFLEHIGLEKRELITSISMMFSTLEALGQHEGPWYKLPRLKYIYTTLPLDCCPSRLPRFRGFATLVEKGLGSGEVVFLPYPPFYLRGKW